MLKIKKIFQETMLFIIRRLFRFVRFFRRLLRSKKVKTIGLAILLALIILPIYFWLSGRKTEASWWNESWGYRKAITIDGSKIAGNLTNFPMLVSLTDTNLGSHAQTDGDDLVFTDAQGVKLSHELESFNYATGALIAWVKMPSLSAGRNRVIYIYYGNASASKQDDKNNVWDSSYAGVWHLGDGYSTAAGFYKDSTRNGNNGQLTDANANSAQYDGTIGKAIDFNGDADWINFGTDSSVEPNTFTLEAWVRYDTGTWEPLASFNTSDYPTVIYNYTNYASLSMGSSNYRNFSGTTPVSLNNTNWHHIVFTLPGNGINDILSSIMYADGQAQSVDYTANGAAQASKNRFSIGIADGWQWFNGKIDEVRLSSVVRSATWVQTEYNNQSDPASFLTAGREEISRAPVAYWSFDEGQGTIAHDEASNKNDGTISGAIWKPESECVSGKCLYFDGSNDYVEVPESDSLAQTGQFTAEAWVRTNDTSLAGQAIMNKGSEVSSPVTKIYRSNAIGATGALDTGSADSNGLVVSGSLATFSIAVPNNVGVGDVLQYDSNNNGSIGAGDTLAFIYGRIDSQHYIVKTASGGTPVARSSNTTWSIFRAYTDFGKATYSGQENTGIDSNLRDFDTWWDGKNIVTSNEQWNIACYANGTTGDWGSGAGGWTTSATNYLRIYTPYLTNEVGVSQRHAGVWDDSKYHQDVTLTSDNANNISIANDNTYVRIDGLQLKSIKSGNYTSNGGIVVMWHDGQSSNIQISNNIIQQSATDGSSSFGIFAGNDPYTTVKIWNNIIYNYNRSSDKGMYLRSTTAVYAYNNTIYNCSYGIVSDDSSTALLKNNVILGTSGADYYLDGVTFVASSTNNASNDGTAPNLNEITLSSDTATGYFTSTSNFHIDTGATYDGEITDTGVSLWSDANSAFKTDIDGTVRTGAWDLGADELNGAPTSARNYKLSLSGDEPGLEWEDSGATARSYATTTANLPANVWKHVVYRRDGSNEAIYVDGKKISEASIGYATYRSFGSLFIGAENQYGTNAFKGYLDDMKIFPYARTADQIKQDYNAGLASQNPPQGASATFGSDSNKWLTDGLVGYWKMDEASWNGTTGEVKDASGNDSNGTSAGGATTAGGKFGNGGSFDGSNDYVDAGSMTSLNSLSQVSACAWVKHDTLTTDDAIVSNHNASNGILLFRDDAGIVSGRTDTYKFQVHQGANATFIEGSNNLSVSGAWTHVCGIFRGTDDVELWVNGVKDTAVPYTGEGVSGTGASANNLRIGNSIYAASTELDGNIDDVRIYNRALSPSEIQKLYEWAPGPVGWWKMDEKVSGNSKTIVDSSGNGNDGTTYYGGNASGMDCTKPGEYGTACSFDGVDDQINISNDASFGITSQSSLTYTAWILINGSLNSYNNIVGDSAGPCFQIRSDNKMNFYNGEQYTSSALTWDNNRWYYVSMILDASTGKIAWYRDGILITSSSANFYSDTPDIFGIGGDEDGENFPGFIDDVRIYNYARTQKQILEDMSGDGPAVSMPIAQYNFDEGYGSTAYNKGIGGTSLNGTLNAGGSGGNTTTTAMWDQNGKNGKAVEFDGVDDYVNTNLSTHFAQTSVSAWIKPAGYGESSLGRILDKNESGAESFKFYFNTSPSNSFSLERSTSSNSGVWTTAASTISLNVWQHVVLTYDESSLSNDAKIYINGVSQPITETSTPTGTMVTNTSKYLIGNRGALDRTFNGLIDDVKIYDYLLTDVDVKTDYNSGLVAKFGGSGTDSTTGKSTNSSAGDYCVPGSTDSCAAPVGEWQMNEKTGTTVYDTSGNGNNGTLGGGNSSYYPTWDRGKYGSGLNFDGTNDYIDLGNPASLSTTSAVTIEGWIKPQAVAYGDAGILYCHGYYNAINKHLVLGYYHDGKIFYALGNGSTYIEQSGNKVLSYGVWQHVALTWSDATDAYVVYVNGVKDVSGSFSGPLSLENFAVIGYAGWGYEIKGSVDDVRVFNYARTPAQIAWDYNKGKPVAEWHFNECQGSTVHDESGNGNDGTISLGASGVTTLGTCVNSASTAWYNGRSGKFGGSLSFDGTDDYVGIGATAPVVNSISLWVKPSSTTQSIIVLDGGSHSVSISSGAVTATGFNSYYVDGKLGGTISDTNWHQIVAIANTAFTTTTSLAIGKISSNYYSGSIDDVKIFNYALTATQMQQLYNGSSIVNFGN